MQIQHSKCSNCPTVQTGCTSWKGVLSRVYLQYATIHAICCCHVAKEVALLKCPQWRNATSLLFPLSVPSKAALQGRTLGSSLPVIHRQRKPLLVISRKPC